MKKTLLLGLMIACLAGCASVQQGKHYSDLAKANSFESYFPSASFTLGFSTLEEANEYINEAQAKLTQSTQKQPQQGLAARIYGSPRQGDKPVIVVCIIAASNLHNTVDLSKTKANLEGELKDAISVSSIFLVFYQDRGVSISKFYLKEGYNYSSNSQYKQFRVNDEFYKAEYPVGWSAEQAFSYLGGGIK
jgi:hypothetical protein